MPRLDFLAHIVDIRQQDTSYDTQTSQGGVSKTYNSYN